jgi:heme/copper-type cytochrome/quinol oxidase subunit 3
VATHGGSPAAHTATGLNMLKLGFWIFLGSETLFFGSLISTYMVYKHESVVGPHPTEILNIPLTSISTFVLLMSSLAVVIALDALQRGLRSRALFWIMAVVVLGSMFLGFQAYEFTHFYHEGLTLQTNLFGSTFFVLTGFHGVHVTVGVLMLLSLVGMSFARRLPDDPSFPIEMVGLYWHFVDIVWIVIFTVVYLVPTPNPGA